MSSTVASAALEAQVAHTIIEHPELSYTDIGKQYGVSATKVARIAVQHDIQRPRGYNQYHYGKAKRQARRDQAIIAYQAAHPKATYAAIGAHFGLSEYAIAQVLSPARARRQVERDERIAARLRATPDFTYAAIADELGVHVSSVRRVAKNLGLESRLAIRRKPQGTKCYKCSILINEIEEGVAIVQVGKAHKRACQDCVERFDLEVVRWEREPVEWAKEDAPHCFDIARASWPAELLEVA